MRAAFALQKLLTFISTENVEVSHKFMFKEKLTNDIVSFEQPGQESEFLLEAPLTKGIKEITKPE